MALSEEIYFDFIWKVQNLNKCTHSKGEPVESPCFRTEILDGTEWVLVLYPKGPTNFDFMSIDLCRKDTGTGYDPIVIDHEISILSTDGSQLFKEAKTNSSFCGGQSCQCINEIRDKLWKQRCLFLPDSTLTINCRMRKSNYFNGICHSAKQNNSCFGIDEMCIATWKCKKGTKQLRDVFPKSCCARTRFRQEKRSFEFNVKHFGNTLAPNTISVPVVSVSKDIPPLLLSLVLNGNTAEADICMSSMEENSYISLSYDISVIDTIGKHYSLAEGEHVFHVSERLLTLRLFQFQSNALVQENGKLLPSGECILKCVFSVSDGTYYSEFEEVNYTKSNTELTCEYDTLQENIFRFHMEKKFSDVVLCAGDGKEFPAHKLVLCARSPVFSAMFENATLEKETGIVNISDLDANTLARMLKFMYCGKLGDLDYKSTSKLFVAADKYQLTALKKRCSSILTTALTKQNCCDLLIFSDFYQEQILKSTVQNFIFTHAKNILVTDQWKNIIDTKIELANAVLHQFSTKIISH